MTRPLANMPLSEFEECTMNIFRAEIQKMCKQASSIGINHSFENSTELSGSGFYQDCDTYIASISSSSIATTVTMLSL
jgi:hypothetical protein